MNDFRDPPPSADPSPAAGSDEALSAYLLGELAEDQVAPFEARLAADPALAARLDRLAGALVALAGADDLEEPAGFAERLDARLEAESAAVGLDARRARRQRWNAVLTAAAGVAVVAVAGISVFGGSGQDSATEGQIAQLRDGSESADLYAGASADDGAGAEMALEESTGDTATMRQEAPPLPSGSGETAGSGGESVPMEPTAGDSAGGRVSDGDEAATEPVITDEGAALENDADLRRRYASLPESERLRGMSRDEAAEVAVRHAERVRAAGPFPSSAVRPDACLEEVDAGRDGRIVSRVERVTWQGGEALVYVLALPREGSPSVDAFEAWVMNPTGCDTRRFVSFQ